MTPRIRLVALDLDGTLLNSRGRVSEANAAAVRAAAAAGAVVVLATARWYATAARWAGRLGVAGPVICHSGALVRDGGSGRDLLHLTLDLELARRVAALGDERRWVMYTTVGEVTHARPFPGVDPGRLPPELRPCERHAEALVAPPTSILIFGQEALAEVCERFEDACRELARFGRNETPGFPAYLTLTHPEADKGRALLAVCRHLGVDPADAMALGDAPADAEMFEAVGLGVAMGNAPDGVKARARDVAPTNDEDGVAWAIRRYVLGA
ncbi:MAG TPA: HAD-IIB family hydrolase [Dehalococcoidia bacterium]